MTMSGAESSPCKPPTAPRPNRLGLSHLLLWLTLTSIVMAITQHVSKTNPFDDAAAEDYAARWRIEVLLGFAVAPSNGAALCGLLLAFSRLFTRRSGFPSQPGHWLLLILAAAYCLSALGHFVTYPSTGQSTRALYLVSGQAVPTVVSGIAGFACRRERRWLWTFGLWSLGLLLHVMGVWALIWLSETAVFPGSSLLVTVPTFIVLGAMLLSLVSSLLDLRTSESRDIFHWIGAAALFAVVLKLVVSMLIWRWAF
jgi:hypothetical protein